ncbi:MAG TPA: DNA internalization-related competence protein ComEC/Rec2 [Gaiellaceae bacterium]|nr:DNA internalization-related competence protein ComEC/Rec2 [Gaiellaceae bacterium]
MPAAHLLAAALCLGLALSPAVRATGPAPPLAAALLALAAPRLGRRRVVALALALLAAGWWWGSERLVALDRSALADEVGRASLARLEVTGPPRRSEFAVRVPVRVLRFGRVDVGERARLDLPPGRAPPQGAIVEAVATVERPRAAEEADGFDEQEQLRRRGIHVVLDADSFRVVGRRGGLAGLADRLRAAVARTMAPGLEGERRAVVAGVVLGEDEGLGGELRDSFRASGLYHLLAVSGQNVAYVVAGMLLLAWALGLPRWVGEVAAILAVGGYVAAVGWQPSVVRAGIAGGLASLAWLAARPRDRWYFLLVGAAVLLAWNPYSLLEPGFQLSFAAVAGIFVLVPRLERRLEGYPLPRRLAEVVAVSGACGAVTAPIVWLHFGAIPLYSVPANALAAPVVAPLLGLALVATALASVLPGAAEALAWVNGWLAAYLAACARLVGGLPYAEATSESAVLVLASTVVLVAVLVAVRPPKARRAAAVLALAVALLVAWRSAPEDARPPARGLRVTVLDVGQGDATLLEVPGGAVLVDQGPPEADVAHQLEALGVTRLDLLVLTHPSRDNIGGAEDVVRRLDVGLLLEPALPFDNPYGEPALAEARRRGVRVAVTRAGQEYRLGGLRLRVLWPDGSASPAADPNDHATVLLASYGSTDVLLPADAESNVTLPLRPPPVEILKVAHHGSADERLAELLARTRPRVAAVSAGAGNEYGHPAPSTVAALEAVRGLAVYRTDEDGGITIESDGQRLAVRTER